jgi:hypothetical protein
MKLSSPITMAYPGPPRRAAGLARYVLLAVVILGLLYYLRNSAQTAALKSAYKHIDSTPADLPGVPSNPNPTEPGVKPADPLAMPGNGHPTNSSPHAHPIDALIEAAKDTFEELLKKESRDLPAAAAEYRKRRGRHPPPGFDVWFQFAQENGAVMVEDFFDQIYHDLGPFWGVPPSTMRKEAWDYEMVINVRNHNATSANDWFWTQIWLNLTQTIDHMLPDVDLALNAMDEPRIVVPWEQINKYMEIERATRKMAPPKEVISEFQTLILQPDPEVEVTEKAWEDTSMFLCLG